MRLLHTSDLHLSGEKPETLETLHTVLETSKQYKVDILTLEYFLSGIDVLLVLNLMCARFP